MAWHEHTKGYGRRTLALVVVMLLAGAVGVALATRFEAKGGHRPTIRSSVARRVMRVELHLVPDARERPHFVLMTLGGPAYCMQLLNLAHHLHASLLCTDYGRDGYGGAGGRAARMEDWGDPAYLEAVAQLPARLRRDGVNISKLVLVGASYAGYADAELVATHPELRPDALIIVDSYLDLPARYLALPPEQITRKEITAALGGTLAKRPEAYAARSPSDHLDGLANAMRHGMRLVPVWSVSRAEQREFNGATCSRAANAQWLSELAALLGRPVVGYVTRMRHGQALWHRGRDLLALAGLGSRDKPLLAHRVTFRAGGPIPEGSYCR